MRSGQTRAQAIRKEKRTEIIESLRTRGLVQQVYEAADKLADLDQELDTVQVQRIKASIDTRLSLIKKYLPDLSAIHSTENESQTLEEWLEQQPSPESTSNKE
jgi:hypothetical protein